MAYHYGRAVSGLICLLILLAVGVTVFYRMIDAADIEGNIQGDLRNQTNVSLNATTSIAGIVFSILPLIALIVVAIILLAVVVGFGRRT